MSPDGHGEGPTRGRVLQGPLSRGWAGTASQLAGRGSAASRWNAAAVHVARARSPISVGVQAKLHSHVHANLHSGPCDFEPKPERGMPNRSEPCSTMPPVMVEGDGSKEWPPGDQRQVEDPGDCAA